jgi:glycosyltransferase involved in cell wall biosynthesis
MRHVIVCREFSPAPIPPGGIGTYVANISRLLAEAGEIVHVVAQRWSGAPRAIEERHGGRLIVHRVALEEPFGVADGTAGAAAITEARAFARSDFPAQYFSLQAARLIEKLVVDEGIDVIEAQEWEAPLYYFQLRRALGFGPARRPPCIVHLHSPTEFLFRHNEWDIGRPDYLPMKRMEDYSIAAADAHLCPSRYLAGHAAALYALDQRAIEVIPCPLGEFPVVPRSQDVWERGSICYVGRLEPRKGVIEWVEAAVSVADANPDAMFEFIGADLPYASGMSVRGYVERTIPHRLKSRFVFHGSQPHAALPSFLGRARAAVVPSRWENCPNTCIEAMATGLPVIASRNGGMVEMLEDERTGWLARTPGPAGLAEALQRALSATPHRRAEMGQAAAAAIREICDTSRLVERHLAFRRAVAARGTTESDRLPSILPYRASQPADGPERRRARLAGEGIAIVLTAAGGGDAPLTGCLHAIRKQRRGAAVVVVVVDADAVTGASLPADPGEKTIVVTRSMLPRAAARNAGVAEVLDRGFRPLGFAFLEAGDRIAEEFVDRCESVLRHCPEVGLISSWLSPDGPDRRWDVHPCPALPYELLASETMPATVIRTETLEEVGGFRPEMRPGYDDWDVAVAALAAGWTAVTFPAILVARPGHPVTRPGLAQPAHNELRRKILARCPGAVARDAVSLLLLAEARRPRDASPPSAATARRVPPRAMLTARGTLAAPRATIGRAIEHARRTAGRLATHMLSAVVGRDAATAFAARWKRS